MREKALLSLIDLYLKSMYDDEDEVAEEAPTPTGKSWRVIKVGYDTVKIFINDFHENDFGVFSSDVDERIIIINSKIDRKSPTFFQTVMHEIMHAYAYVFNSDDTIMDEEKWVETSAAYFSTFINDNKKFFLELINDCM